MPKSSDDLKQVFDLGKVPPSYRIRALNERDEGRWHALFKAFHASSGASIHNDVVAQTWQRLCHREDNMFAFVAELPSRSISNGYDVVGIVHGVIHASTVSLRSHCCLEGLYVDAQARGHGIGTALIKAVIREADRRGSSRTYWMTDGERAEAHNLFDSLAERLPLMQFRYEHK